MSEHTGGQRQKKLCFEVVPADLASSRPTWATEWEPASSSLPPARQEHATLLVHLRISMKSKTLWAILKNIVIGTKTYMLKNLFTKFQTKSDGIANAQGKIFIFSSQNNMICKVFKKSKKVIMVSYEVFMIASFWKYNRFMIKRMKRMQVTSDNI